MFVKSPHVIFIPLLISVLFFNSCKFKKEDFENLKIATYTPEWGLSLVKTDMYVSKALNKANSSTGNVQATIEDGIITLTYSNDIALVTGADFFRLLNNFKVGSGVEVGDAFVNTVNSMPVGSTTPSFSFPSPTASFPMVIPNVGSYSRVKVRSGTLTITGKSKVRHDVKFEVEFNTITKNNTPLTKTFDFKYLGNANYPTEVKIGNEDMAGYELKPTPGTFDIPFTIKNITVKRLDNDSPPSGNAVHANDSLSLAFTFTDFMIEEMDAKDVNFSSPVPPFFDGRVGISVFENSLNEGSVPILNPSVTISPYNQMPLTVKVKLDTLALNTPHLPKSQKLSQFSDPATAVTDTITVPAENTSNPDIYTVKQEDVKTGIMNSPNALLVSFNTVRLTSAPNQTVTIKADQAMWLRAKVKLPLEGSLNGLAISDTNLVNEMPRTGVVQSMEIILYSENYYPFDLGFRAYFLDTSNVVLFALPRLNEDNLVLKANTQNFKKSYSVSRAEYDLLRLERTAKVALNGTFDTRPSGTNIKFTADQYCRIQIVAKAKGNIDLNNPDDNLIQNVKKEKEDEEQ